MLTSFQSAYKTIIFTKNSGEKLPIARFIDFVINPDNGVFEAIWVEAIGGFRIVSPKDILQWNEEEIMISDEQEILDPESLPRLKKIIDREVAILEADVFSGKRKLGKVVDFAFDTISPRLLSITVKSGFWIFGTKRIIRHDRILKMTKKGIFVSEPTVKITDEEKPHQKTKNQMPNLGD